MAIILGRKPGGAGGGSGGSPTGPAGGDLSGTYPNPSIANGVVTVAMLDSEAATDGQILTADGAGGVAYENPPLLKVFDSTLGADAASIDSGAGSIPAGYAVLEVWMILRTTQATDVSAANIRVNNDSGNNYDRQTIRGASTSATAAASLAQAQWQVPAPGANQLAGSAATVRLTIPGYADTTFHKTAESLIAVPDDTAGNNHIDADELRWRDTSAITRIAVTANSGNLLAGSRLIVYVRA